ncbi:MAG: hypothetical protein JWM98_1388 [Thermoleophilia bacterium]|nr:hypothetical protein [Thermoleophilia bacterium]
MNKDWRPSFILAYAIFIAVVVSLHADKLVEDGGGSFTIALVVMSVILVALHAMKRGSRD